jgi:uroporphyrin-III C-methyltransferase
VKASRVLRQCDVVLYDRLVHPEIVALARPDAECIYVGKHQGEQELRQEEIFDLIRDRALQGKTVGRLKGGDSLVFGRGAEEWQLALAHGIRVELIPGISSAVSVPGLAGIPLTFRSISQSFAVVTGHCREGLEHAWEHYARVDTLVILMGVKNRQAIASGLIAAGRPANQAAAFVYRGSLQEEQTIVSTLAEVAAGKVEVRNPAVFVIGEVVNLRRLLKPSAV